MSKSGTQHGSKSVTASVRLPQNALPGQIFHCTIRGRYFEVMVPPNATPGTLIHVEFQGGPEKDIEYSKSGAMIFKSVGGLYEATIETAHVIDDKYRIYEKAESFIAPVLDRLNQFDEKVHIKSKVTSLYTSGASKVSEVDNRLRVSMYFCIAGEWVVGSFREVDRFLGLSNTSAKLILFSANTASWGLNKLVNINNQHHILENVGGVVTMIVRPFGKRKQLAIEAPVVATPPVPVKEIESLPDLNFSSGKGKKVYLKT